MYVHSICVLGVYVYLCVYCMCVLGVYTYVPVCSLYVCTGCIYHTYIMCMHCVIVWSCVHMQVLYFTYAVFSTTVHKRVWWGVEVHRSVSLHNDCSHFIPCASPVYPNTVQGSGEE